MSSTNDVKERLLVELGRYHTGRDFLFTGHCRLRILNGEVVPFIGPAVSDINPDGIFPDFTLSIARDFLIDVYKRFNDCSTRFGLLLNNVEIGRDPRSLPTEPDFRRKQAESKLANYLLDLREQWKLLGIPKQVLSWFSIGQDYLPFLLESHLRSMMDRTIGSLARQGSCIFREDGPAGTLFYYRPHPSRQFLVTSFARQDAPTDVVASTGVACHGTGCAGEVTMLLRECERYKDRVTGVRFEPQVVFNIAPDICFEPVNIGTELAYDLFDLRFRTVNVFIDPQCTNIHVTVHPD